MLSTKDIKLDSSYSSLIADDYCHDEVRFNAFIKRIVSKSLFKCNRYSLSNKVKNIWHIK
jgi:hypothetical protein